MNSRLSHEILSLIPITSKENEKEEIEAFKKRWYASKDLLDIIKKVIENRERDKGKSRATDYDKASWPYFAADREGYKRALEEIKILLP